MSFWSESLLCGSLSGTHVRATFIFGKLGQTEIRGKTTFRDFEIYCAKTSLGRLQAFLSAFWTSVPARSPHFCQLMGLVGLMKTGLENDGSSYIGWNIIVV